MTGTGLKKCSPPNRSFLFVTEAMSWMDNDDVLEANIVWSGATWNMKCIWNYTTYEYMITSWSCNLYYYYRQGRVPCPHTFIFGLLGKCGPFLIYMGCLIIKYFSALIQLSFITRSSKEI
jgi:hypothetical protein